MEDVSVIGENNVAVIVGRMVDRGTLEGTSKIRKSGYSIHYAALRCFTMKKGEEKRMEFGKGFQFEANESQIFINLFLKYKCGGSLCVCLIACVSTESGLQEKQEDGRQIKGE